MLFTSEMKISDAASASVSVASDDPERERGSLPMTLEDAHCASVEKLLLRSSRFLLWPTGQGLLNTGAEATCLLLFGGGDSTGNWKGDAGGAIRGDGDSKGSGKILGRIPGGGGATNM